MFFLMAEQLAQGSNSFGEVNGAPKTRWRCQGHCGWRCDQKVDIQDRGTAIGGSSETCHISLSNMHCRPEQVASALPTHCRLTETNPEATHLVSGRDWDLRFGVSWSHVARIV